MLGFLKEFWKGVVDAVDRWDESVFGPPEASVERQNEVWRGRAEDQRSGQKRTHSTDLESGVGSSSKKLYTAVQTNAQVQHNALAPTPAPARLGEGAATNAAEVPAPSRAAASAASAGTDVVAEQMYEGITLETMPLSEEHAALVYGTVPTMMWTVDKPHWRFGQLCCRKAMIRPHGDSTFLMNFTEQVHGSLPVQLQHCFSIEDLEYMHDIPHRMLCPTETRHYGILTPLPVV